MAKNYKRHAQGQRFKSSNFGDMGLRAYREQQQTIINAMKLQKKQHKSIRDEYLSGEIDKARKERENRAELKALEDDVYDNKFLNTQIRADREIDQLKQQAKEHQKSADFWQDFSTTYAKQYGDAYKNIHDAIDLRYAQKIINQQRGDGGIYETAISTSKILNNISSAGIINEVDRIYTDPKNNGHFKRTEHAHSLDIEKRRSHNLNNILSSQLIEDSDKIITHLKDTLERFDPKNPNKKIVKITKDNIQGIIEQRALEIMGNLGMDPNSEGGQKFLDHMWNVASDEAFKKHKIHWAKEDEDTLYNQENGLLVGLKANRNNPIEWEDKFNHTIKLYQHRYVIGENGEASLQELNVKEAYSAVQELLINEGIITRENLDLLNIAFPGQARSPEVTADPTLDKRQLMWARHPDLEKEARDSLLKKEKADHKNKTEKEKVDDAVALAKVKESMDSGDFDPNNLDQTNALIEANRGNKDTLEFLHKLRVYNPKQNDTQGYLVNEKINSEYNSNDYVAYTNSMQFLGKEDRQRFNKFTKQLDELNANGATNEQVRKYVERFIKGKLGIADLNTTTHATAGPMADAMIQDFYFQYRAIANDDKYTSGRSRVDAAYAKIVERYNSKEGIYSTKSDTSGANTVFSAMAGVEDPDTSIKVGEELDTLLNKGWDNALALAGTDEDPEFLDQDWLDTNLRNIIHGDTVEQNDVIDRLYYTQPIRENMLSKTQILNKLLEAKGIKTKVPLGALDKVDRDLIQNAQINIGNYRNMSDENKMRMKVFLETGTMPTAKPKDVKKLEKNNEIRKNYLNSLEYKRTQLEEIRLKEQLEKKK